MSKQTDIIDNLLHSLNLSEEESKVFLYLAGNTSLTALDISKKLKLGRTKVYRILDKLYKMGLTDQIVGSRGYLFETNPFESLNQLVAEKELELEKLKTSVPTVIDNLTELKRASIESKDYKIKYYEGTEGLKQVTWNSVKGPTELLIYEIESMNAVVERSFAEKARMEAVKTGRKTRELTNHKKWGDFTKVRGYAKNYWESRYIDPKIFEIEVETLVYDDVVALYHIDVEEPFCVEIYNKRLANMQRQIFNFIWSKAKKMRKIGEGGAAEVV